MDDIEIVKALKKNNKIAFKYLFERYYSRIVSYITTYTHNQSLSEDIAQQAFIHLWEDRFKLDDGKSPKNYLYAIAYNRYIDTIKKSKKRELLLEEIWESALRNRIMDDSELLEKRIDKMKLIIDSLPPKCKEIIQLNKIQGVTYREIAKLMGVSIKTVESQMRIAFKKIREGFKNDHLVLFILIRSLKEV